jgi:outer membrane receptor protein involved in Fe transport
MAKSRALSLPDALDRRVPGVTLNDAQGSPLQLDLSYRGFTVSPLLGLPQGLAVYQNGIRVNEPFGDTLKWDLVPQFAIEDAVLVTGLNPVYGLNALGGALALRMKDGFSMEGARANGLAGAFGRVSSGVEAGVNDGQWAAYAAGDVFRESGWRDHSPSDVRRLYFDVRERSARHEIALNASLGSSDLTGNGPVPLDLMRERRASVFTYPDQSVNALALLGAQGQLALGRRAALNATAYFRTSIGRTLNGDEAELAACDVAPELLCEEDSNEPVTDERGGFIPSSAGGQAAVNTSRTHSTSGGGVVQLVSEGPWLARANRFSVGLAADFDLTRFSQRSEVGELTGDRTVSPSGFFLGDEGRTQLRVYSTRLGIYASDTFSIAPRLHLTLGGRFNWIRVRLRDQLGGELTGDHTYARLNAGAGLAFVPRAGVVVYVHYAESSRAPTAAELGCADPDEPCRLPNAMLSDPPLQQVVTRSAEIGLRVRRGLSDGRHVAGSLAVFAARNSDDILFVAGSRIGTGYFRNAGTTQRAGVEAALSIGLGAFEPYASYQLLRASFESELVLPGANHPDAIDTPEGGVIQVEPGDHLPGLPMHSARVGSTVTPVTELSFDVWAEINSSQYYRGDEANLLAPIPGYAALSARAAYQIVPEVSLFVRADNLLNAEFETFGLLGDAEEVIEGAEDPRFRVPAPPRAAWAGLEVQLVD